MPVQRIVTDTRIWFDSDPFRVCVVSADGTVTLESERRRHEVKHIQYADLCSDILNGVAKMKPSKLLAAPKSIDIDSLNQKLKQDIDGLSPVGRREFERKWKYIRPLNSAQLKRLQKKVVEPVISDVAKNTGDLAPPSFDTVRRWYRDFLTAGRDIRALFPATGTRGWRTRRLPAEVGNIARRVIAEVYLTPLRNSVAATYSSFIVAIDLENRNPIRRTPLETPSLRWFYREIDRQFDRYDQELARSGKIAADLKFRTWGRGPRPMRALERVEIDHTIMDIVVVDDQYGNAIGRPTITAAIDVATRMIIGFYVSFKGPSYHSVVKCLRHAIMPKKDALARYPEIQNSWDAFGIPEAVVVDNGREFHAKHLEEACRHLNIQVQHTPRRQPWQKPKVERLFGTLNTELLSGMHGKTFPNVVKRGDYKSKDEACVSFSNLIKVLYMWVVDVYNQTPRSGTLEAPAKAWSRASVDFPPVPCNADDLNFALTSIEYRKIHPKGILLKELWYQHKELSRLSRRIDGDLKVTVKWDSGDLGSILVIDPDNGHPIRISAVDHEYARELSLSQHDTIRRFIRDCSDDRVRQLSRAKVRELVRLIIAADWRRKKKGWTKKSAIYSGLDSDNPGGRLNLTNDPELLRIAGEVAPEYHKAAAVDEDPSNKNHNNPDDDFDDDDQIG